MITIFSEKIGVFLKKQCYDRFLQNNLFKITASVLGSMSFSPEDENFPV
jgi:hypothetical protein